MSRFNRIVTCLGLVWPTFLISPVSSTTPPKPTDVVAVVDGHSITVEETQKRLTTLAAARSGIKPEDLKQKAVNELINEYLAGFRARLWSLENDSGFMRRTDEVLADIANRELFSRMVLSVVSVSDSEIVKLYRQNPESFTLAPWVHASHILISPVTDTFLLTARQKETGWWAKTDDQAKLIADSIYQMFQAGLSFDSLAREWSQDMASGMYGGDLGRFPPGRMVPEFDSVAFHMPVASISRPVKTRFGFHLIKVFSRQQRRGAPLDDSLKIIIKQQILNGKIMERTQVFIDSLCRNADLTYNEKIFEMADSVLAVEKVWAAASRFGDTIRSDRLASQLITAQPPVSGGKKDRDYKIALLKDAINPFLLRRAVTDLKIDESQAYLDRRAQLIQSERLGRVLRQSYIEYNPTEEEMREYYQKHRQDFLPPESISVHVEQMIFRARKEADEALQELRSGGEFSLLARKYFPGDSDVAQEAFDLGFISPPAMPGNFFAVAETLTIGAVSQPIRTRWGYHLIRVLARRPDLNFEAAQPKIKVTIRKAKQDEHKSKWEAALREGHRIVIRERVLKSIKFDPNRAAISD